MDCARSVELLSEFHAGALDESDKAGVAAHLAECPPCDGIYLEITLIIETAVVLRESEETIVFPDEIALWQRMNLTKRAVYQSP